MIQEEILKNLDAVRKKLKEAREENSDLKEVVDELEDVNDSLVDDIEDLKEEIEELEQDSVDQSIAEFPCPSLNDVMKAEKLLTIWESVTLEDIDRLAESVQKR